MKSTPDPMKQLLADARAGRPTMSESHRDETRKRVALLVGTTSAVSAAGVAKAGASLVAGWSTVQVSLALAAVAGITAATIAALPSTPARPKESPMEVHAVVDTMAQEAPIASPTSPPTNTPPLAEVPPARAPRPRLAETTTMPAPVDLTPAPTSEPAVEAPPVVHVPEDSLANETRILAEAKGALDRGDSAKSLGLLRQYNAQFPQGRLRSEAAAANVFALCAAGRSGDAQSAAVVFLTQEGKGPLYDRVRASCAFAPQK